MGFATTIVFFFFKLTASVATSFCWSIMLCNVIALALTTLLKR